MQQQYNIVRHLVRGFTDLKGLGCSISSEARVLLRGQRVSKLYRTQLSKCKMY